MLRTILVLIIGMLLCLPAAAENKLVKISGTHGMGEIAGACASAGGEFIIHSDAGGYGCTKKDCDGKGGDCHVACDNGGNCNGSTPARILKAVTMFGLLQNGNMVYRNQAGSAGGPQSLSGSAGAAAAPVVQPAPEEPFD